MSRGKVAVFTDQPASSAYIRAIVEHSLKIAAHINPGGVAVLHIMHGDDWALMAGAGPCDCDPTLQVKREAIP